MKRQQYIVMGVFAALFLAVTYLGWALLVKPVNADIDAKTAELQTAQDKLKEAESKAAQHDMFQALAENIRRNLLFISGRVDPVMETKDLYTLLSSMGNRLALPNYAFTVKARAKSKSGAGNMDEFPINVTFNAGFHQVGLFLTWAISQNRLIVPDKLSLTPLTPQDESIPTLSANMDMRLVLETAP